MATATAGHRVHARRHASVGSADDSNVATRLVERRANAWRPKGVTSLTHSLRAHRVIHHRDDVDNALNHSRVRVPIPQYVNRASGSSVVR
jgi:hypothetical protein